MRSVLPRSELPWQRHIPLKISEELPCLIFRKHWVECHLFRLLFFSDFLIKKLTLEVSKLAHKEDIQYDCRVSNSLKHYNSLV